MQVSDRGSWRVSSSLDEATIQNVANHVIAYLNAQRGWWIYRPLAVVVLSFVFFLFLGQVFGSLLTIAYTTWVLMFWARRLATIVDMVNLLGPVLKKVPEGLDDIGVTSAVFTEASIASGSSRRARVARVGGVARSWFTSAGPGLSYDCGDGHGFVCGHRASAASKDFWSLVAKAS
jgi:hypothetical protein